MAVPGGSIGTAFVTILPNTDRFTATLVLQLRGASSAASSAGTQAARSAISWDMLGRSISDAGSNAAKTSGDFIALGAGADFATDQIQDLNKALATSGVIRGGGLFGGPPGKGIATDIGSAFRDASNLIQGFIGFLTLVTPTVNIIIAALVSMVSLLGSAVIAAAGLAAALGATAVAMGVAAYRWQNLLASGAEDAETWRGALIAIEAEAFNMVETLISGFSRAGEAGTDMWTAVGEAGVRFLRMMQPIIDRVTDSIVNFMSAFSGTGGESPFLNWMRRWLQEWKVLGQIVNEGIAGGGGLLGFFEKYEAPAMAFAEAIARIINGLRQMSALGLGLNMDQLAEFITNVGLALQQLVMVFPRFSNALVTVGLELSRFLLALMPIVTEAFLVGEAILKGIVAPIVTGLVKALEFVMTLPIVDWLIAVAGGITLVAFAMAKLTLSRLPFGLLMQTMLVGFVDLSGAIGQTILRLVGFEAMFRTTATGAATMFAKFVGGTAITLGLAAAMYGLMKAMQQYDEMQRRIEQSARDAFDAMVAGTAQVDAFAQAYEGAAAAFNETGFFGKWMFTAKHFFDIVIGGLSNTTLVARDTQDALAGVYDEIAKAAKEAVSTGTPWTDQMIADIQGLQERAGEFAMGASPIPPNIEDFITGWQEAFVVGEGLEMRPIYDEDAFNLALEKWQDQKQAGMDLQEILNGLNRDYDSGAINAGQYATYMDILNDKFETGVTDIELWELKVQGAAQTIADGLLEVSNSGEVATSGIKRFGDALGVSIVDFREKALKAFNDVAGGISGSGEKIREWFLQQQAAIKNWRLEFADGVNFVSQAWGTLAQDANLTAGEIVAGLDEAVQATRDLRTNMTEVIEKGLSEEALEQIYTLPADQMATIFAGLSTATGKQIDQINTKVARGGDIAASVATTAADAINLTMERLTGAVELMVASILNIDPSEVSAMVDDIVNRANESTARLKNRTVDIGFNVDESSLIGGLMQGTGTSTSQAKTPEIPLPDLGKVTTDFQAVGTAATQGIEQGMTTGAAGVRAAADALGTEMVDATAQSIGAASPATEFIAIGNSVIEGLVLGISQKSHLLTLQMRGIGANMAQGMREGLLQGLSTLAAEAVERAREIVRAIKNEFGITSPSRVFYEIGSDMAEGMRLGVAEGMEQVRFDVGAMQMRGNLAVQQTASRPHLDGDLRIRDWRSGIASLDGELAWESLVRRS